MDAPQSKEAGLYGDSMYPPMFDDEPPPFDDDDNDDDGFADFGAFQTTKSVNADSNWSSWNNTSSAEVKKPIAGNDDDFGNFNQAFGGPKKEDKGIVMNGLSTTMESNSTKDFSANEKDGDTPADLKIERHQDVKAILGSTANSENEQSFPTFLKHGQNDNGDGFGEFGSFGKVVSEVEPTEIVIDSEENSQKEHMVLPATEDARVESGINSGDTLRESSNINKKSSTLEEPQTLSDKSDDLNSESFASFEKSDSLEIDSEFTSFSNHNSFDKLEGNGEATNGESKRNGKLFTEDSIDNGKSLIISVEMQRNPEADDNTTKGISNYLVESSNDSFDKKDDFQNFSYVSKSITGRQNTESFTQNKQQSSLDREAVLISGNALIENENSQLRPHEDGVRIDCKNLNGSSSDAEKGDDVSFRTGEFESFSNDSTEDKNTNSLDNDNSWASFNTYEKDNLSAKFAPNFENSLVGATDKPNENVDTSTTTTKYKHDDDEEESFASFDFQRFSENNESLSSSEAKNSQFRSIATNQSGKDMFNNDGYDDFKDFSSVEPSLNISSKIMTNSEIDAELDGEFEEFESFSKIEKTEESWRTSSDGVASRNFVEDVAPTSLTKNPSEIAPSSKEFVDSNSNDDFGDFGAFDTSEKSKTQFEIAPDRTETKENSDFGNKGKLNVDKESEEFDDFGAFGVSESSSAFGDLSGKVESNIQSSEKEPPSTKENDDFGNFGSFASPESFPATFSKPNDEHTNFGSKSDDSDWAQFSISTEGPENSKKEVIDEDFDDFAAFPGDEKKSDLEEDDWASFSSQSPTKDNKPVITKMDNFGSFRKPSVMKEKQPMPSKGLSSKVGLLVSTCFPESTQQPLQAQPAHNSNLESYIDDDKNQGSLCVWCKLTDDAQVDDVWNLSYMSSTSFKWLLLTMNVTFEHIIKKWKHPSRDTLSSLSPTSSVASFDVETASDSLGILIPEPANRLNSLLKPTLLAQSQQKELNLQRVPSMSSLKKGDSGSDTTSETASLDLEFFSGAVSMQPSLQKQLTKDSSTSLNGMDLLDIDLASEPTASAGDGPPIKRGPAAMQLGSQTEGKSQSLPFNLNALNKAASKSEISTQASEIFK
eukprot:Seg41.4 transcript_id=Seg41.4/GoldUCD/mRNA.D3Y31 product="hypothetical protein" protein_id=Seg41.4/GoldUCD/D3Y31